MTRSIRAQVAASLCLASAALVLTTGDARACGGYFYAEPVAGTTENASVVTDHRVAIAITETMTTLWDQVEYAGDPEEFAWVLPVRGGVTLGLGHDGFLQSLDAETAPQIVAPRRRCARPVNDGCGGNGSAGCGSADEAGGDWDFETGYQEDSGIFVTDRTVVGPYAAVTVHGDDPGSIVGWLRGHKFKVPTDVEPTLGQYVTEKFDFLVVRLRPNRGVHTMVPIRVSWKGSTPTLPLRIARAGITGKVGIKLFIIGEGRYTAKNFPVFSVDPEALTWDFPAQKSDYVEIRDAMAAKFDGRAFSLESSIDLLKTALPSIASTPPPLTDAGPATTDSGVTTETGGDDDAGDAGSDDAGAAEDTAKPEYDAGKPPAVDPYASDVDIAFGNIPQRRVTRLRGELPAKFLDADLELVLDDNQTTLDRKVQVDRATSAPVCPGVASVAGDGSAPIRASIVIVLGALGAILARRASRR